MTEKPEKQSNLRKRLKKGYCRIKNVFHGGSSSSQGDGKFSRLSERLRYGATKPQAFAYQLVGGRSSRFFPLFKDLDASLKKSGMKSNFKAYVSTTILASLLASASVMLVVPMTILFVFQLSLFSALLFGVGLSLLAGAITVMAFYAYGFQNHREQLPRKLQ